MFNRTRDAREQLLGSLMETVDAGREVFKKHLAAAIQNMHLLPASMAQTPVASYSLEEGDLSLTVTPINTDNGIDCATLEVRLVSWNSQLRRMLRNALNTRMVSVEHNRRGKLTCTIDAGTNGLKQDYNGQIAAGVALLRQQCTEDRLAAIEQHAQRR